MNKIYIYHGSEYIIKKPELKFGKKNNDYGQGFYCTEDIEKAKEWACKSVGGYINKYSLDLKDLKVLNLTSNEYNCLNWVALLLKNRSFDINNSFSSNNKDFILNNYLIDTSNYDVIIGYRADDSYFRYASAFVENSLPISALEKALKLGELGIQIVLVSNKSFKNFKYVSSETVDYSAYHFKHLNRDANARTSFNKLLKKNFNPSKETFILDLIRKEDHNA